MGTGAASGGAPSNGEGFSQGISFAPELHRATFLIDQMDDMLIEVIRAVDCAQLGVGPAYGRISNSQHCPPAPTVRE